MLGSDDNGKSRHKMGTHTGPGEVSLEGAGQGMCSVCLGSEE